MLKITRFVFTFLLSLAASGIPFTLHAQVVSTESFDGVAFLPAGWSGIGNTNLWSRRTAGTFPTCANHSGAGMARYGSRGVPAKTTQSIASPAFDLSARGSKTPKISLWIFRDNGSTLGDSLSVYMNTSASLTGAVNIGMVARYSKMSVPDTVAANGWYQYSFSVPSSFNGKTNYFILKGVSEAGYNIHIDDVQWEAFPELCSGKPVAGSIVPTTGTICNGTGNTTLTLTGSTTGKLGISILWQSSTSASGPFTTFGSINLTQNTGTITATTYFRAIVSCFYSGESDTTAVKAVLVNPKPNPTVTVTPNPASYCQGSAPVVLTASSSSGIWYFWSPANGLDRSDTAVVKASPNVNTNYTVTVTDSFGCTGTATVAVTLRTTPNVIITAADSLICKGDSLRLTAQTGGGGPGNTYLWTPTGQTTASIFAKPTANAVYGVTVKNQFGCERTVSKNLYVNPAPVAKFSYSLKGARISFYNESEFAKNYYWSFGDGNFSTNQVPTYTYSNDGTYTIMLVASNPPCKADSFAMILRIGVNSVKDRKGALPVQVSPNPTSGMLFITGSETQHKELIVYSVDGRTVYIKNLERNEQSINLESLTPGIYTVQISADGQTSRFRILKQ